MAEATIIPFGKFHDHTLGQIAAFEPSYIDWVAGTVNHDPDLVMAARVIQAELDRRGVLRRVRPAPEPARPVGLGIRSGRWWAVLAIGPNARSPPDTGGRS